MYRDLFNTYDPNVLYPIFEDTIRIGFNIKWLVNNLILIILLSPVFFIIFTIYRSFFKVSDFKTKLFLITPISPIVLFIFGYDHMNGGHLYLQIYSLFYSDYAKKRISILK